MLNFFAEFLRKITFTAPLKFQKGALFFLPVFMMAKGDTMSNASFPNTL